MKEILYYKTENILKSLNKEVLDYLNEQVKKTINSEVRTMKTMLHRLL